MSTHFLHYLICYVCITGFTKAAYLRIYDDSIDKFKEFDLESPLELLKAPGYDPTSVTVIYAFGFTGKADGITVKTILGTYLRLGGYNAVGKNLGEALYKLVLAGLNLKKTHLIGFSLGAHVMGYAGRELQDYNLLAPRITGLDPAAPLFDERVVRPLDSYSARYVDVLHTNPGELGSDESIATIDFWFNCESTTQPGCETLSPIAEATCSHDRSWLYFSEALENTTAFGAVSATSCSNWTASNRTGYVVYIGENITFGNKSGKDNKFYLSTNSIPPYGRGTNGLTLCKL